MNRKFLIGMFIVLGVALVIAVTYIAYTHSFTKVINAFDTSEDVEVQVIGLGDISNSTINCDLHSAACSVESGDIILRNPDSVSHTCIVTSTGTDVEVTYGGILDGSNTIAPGDTIFKIYYHTTVKGKHPVTTTINCPA